MEFSPRKKTLVEEAIVRWDLHVRAKLEVGAVACSSLSLPAVSRRPWSAPGPLPSIWWLVCMVLPGTQCLGFCALESRWLSQVGESVGLMSRVGGTDVWALQEDGHVL